MQPLHRRRVQEPPVRNKSKLDLRYALCFWARWPVWVTLRLRWSLSHPPRSAQEDSQAEQPGALICVASAPPKASGVIVPNGKKQGNEEIDPKGKDTSLRFVVWSQKTGDHCSETYFIAQGLTPYSLPHDTRCRCVGGRQGQSGSRDSESHFKCDVNSGF